MDIQVHGAEPTTTSAPRSTPLLGAATSGWEGAARDIERDGRAAHGGRAARDRRDLLLPALHAVQDRVGWVSDGALNYICQRLDGAAGRGLGRRDLLPPASPPRRGRRGGPRLRRHRLPACAAPSELCDQLAERARSGRPTGVREGDGTWLRSPCLGLCERAPAALVVHAGAVRETAALGPMPDARADRARARRRHHRALHRSRDAARRAAAFGAAGGRAPGSGSWRGSAPSIPRASTPTAQPAATRRWRARSSSGPRRSSPSSPPRSSSAAAAPPSRPGASGRRWRAPRRRPHYVVCNADESEPGTFKDRVLLEEDPFAIIEAMTIAGFAMRRRARASSTCAASTRWPRRACGTPSRQARAARACSGDERRRAAGFDFDIEIRRGAGAYICGEETALFNSIEGLRGEPRTKPPFPVEVGPVRQARRWSTTSRPWSTCPGSCATGGEAFARSAPRARPGTKLFCLSGASSAPGSTRCRSAPRCGELLALAGGVPARHAARARSCSAAPPAASSARSALDLPLTFEGTRAAGATLGSGVVMVFDDSGRSRRRPAARIAAFFRDESCGQCVPCRVGTVRQEELLGTPAARRPAGRPRPGAGAASASWRRPCATPRSAASGRRRRPPSSRRWRLRAVPRDPPERAQPGRHR